VTARTSSQASGPPATDVDLLSDEVALARSQLAGGLPILAEVTARELLARLVADNPGDATALEPAYAVLAEALWRQQRPVEAGATLEKIRSTSDLRRAPVALMVEADASAAEGDLGRARAIRDRLVAAIGAEAAWLARAGVPAQLEWPDPFEGVAEHRAPTAAIEVAVAADSSASRTARSAGARARLEAARAAFVAGDAERGEHELGLALRLDVAIAADGIALLESTGDRARDARTLMLYGDLLSAAGRAEDAAAAYDRAAAGGDRVAG
jgi:hypothetical protein